jgi:hypothetical protein
VPDFTECNFTFTVDAINEQGASEHSEPLTVLDTSRAARRASGEQGRRDGIGACG